MGQGPERSGAETAVGEVPGSVAGLDADPESVARSAVGPGPGDFSRLGQQLLLPGRECKTEKTAQVGDGGVESPSRNHGDPDRDLHSSCLQGSVVPHRPWGPAGDLLLVEARGRHAEGLEDALLHEPLKG
jgi:hypothetical protein